ncbi:hypothetical protein LPS_0011 [Legionella pneumophila subsp. pneumophila str. Sudbury]|nr:hypothetical protein LPS_0011 [Legionella pneumophila subsp. pneumophila str. Sudbury]
MLALALRKLTFRTAVVKAAFPQAAVQVVKKKRVLYK